MRFKAFIFDLDGTLVNDIWAHDESWRIWGGEYGLSMTHILKQVHLGGGIDECIARMFDPPLAPAEAKRAGDRKELIFREIYAPHVRPLRGLTRFLDRARSNGIALAMGTNAPLDNVRFLLAGLGLEGFFEPLLYDKSVPVGKPDPAMYRLAAQMLNVPVEACLVFEDSHAGATAAHAAGMAWVGLCTTWPVDTLRQWPGNRLAVRDYTDGRLARLFMDDHGQNGAV